MFKNQYGGSENVPSDIISSLTTGNQITLDQLQNNEVGYIIYENFSQSILSSLQILGGENVDLVLIRRTSGTPSAPPVKKSLPAAFNARSKLEKLLQDGFSNATITFTINPLLMLG